MQRHTLRIYSSSPEDEMNTAARQRLADMYLGHLTRGNITHTHWDPTDPEVWVLHYFGDADMSWENGVHRVTDQHPGGLRQTSFLQVQVDDMPVNYESLDAGMVRVYVFQPYMHIRDWKIGVAADSADQVERFMQGDFLALYGR